MVGKVHTFLFLPLASSPASSPPFSPAWAPLHPLVALRLPPAPRNPLGVFSGAYSVAPPCSKDPVYGWAGACCVRFHSGSSYPWHGCGMPWLWQNERGRLLLGWNGAGRLSSGLRIKAGDVAGMCCDFFAFSERRERVGGYSPRLGSLAFVGVGDVAGASCPLWYSASDEGRARGFLLTWVAYRWAILDDRWGSVEVEMAVSTVGASCRCRRWALAVVVDGGR